jgi:hypothetical protein
MLSNSGILILNINVFAKCNYSYYESEFFIGRLGIILAIIFFPIKTTSRSTKTLAAGVYMRCQFYHYLLLDQFLLIFIDQQEDGL